MLKAIETGFRFALEAAIRAGQPYGCRMEVISIDTQSAIAVAMLCIAFAGLVIKIIEAARK